MFLESVIRFYKRLVKDQDFRSQLETAASPEECRKMMQEAGYEFTQEEFETATVQILEKKGLRDLDDSFSELSEQELELAVGGVWSLQWKSPPTEEPPIIKPPIDIQPLYGVVYQPPEDKPKPDPVPWPQPQPMYGIVIDPYPIQAMYGVVIAEDHRSI